ncbi:MAG: hypothetical protein K0R92_2561 [Lachnospiraceae bacterium]|nr:hypothetical protein [Lachnospiraceae bacterium]
MLVILSTYLSEIAFIYLSEIAFIFLGLTFILLKLTPVLLRLALILLRSTPIFLRFLIFCLTSFHTRKAKPNNKLMIGQKYARQIYLLPGILIFILLYCIYFAAVLIVTTLEPGPV